MLNRDFKECVASFNAHGVEYLVVGCAARATSTGEFAPAPTTRATYWPY
jgi:hypothetical protein